MLKKPQDCQDMAELRVEIDRLDKSLVDLLVERAAYIDRAAEIKSRVGLPARIDDRVEQVVSNVLRHIEGTNLPAEAIETFWRALIEWSIDREDERLEGRGSVSGS